LGLHVVHIRPISTRETAVAYTRLLGWDLNSSPEPVNCGLATVVIVDLWIFTVNEINIMKKKHDPISVVLDCFRVPCVRQISSKRGGELIIATRC
jgi:hypothetical protein